MPNKRGSRGAQKCRTKQRQKKTNKTPSHRPESQRSESSQNNRSVDHKVIRELSQIDLPSGTLKNLKRHIFTDGPDNYTI